MDESRIADPSSALRRSDRSLPTRLSRAVSVVLHPLVMPLYVILLLVAGPTQLSYFPASVKFYLLWVVMLYAVIIMALGFLVFQLIPKELLLMFDASDAMLEIGAPALRIMSLAFIFAGISIVAGSSCQAFGYSVYSMLISIARQIVVLIPAAYLLSLTGVLRSIWFAFPIAEIFSLILSLFFLRTTLKKTGMAMPKTK